MTTSEIRALVLEVNAGHYYECNGRLIISLRDAIEALLAREAEVLEAARKSKSGFVDVLKINTILNQENET